jgi:metal-responsive CopG/Arc/MetJ family transcriptional regulator
MTNILIISLSKRKETSVKVQKILADSGCMIKTRLGIHENPSNACSDKGIIILDVAGTKTEITKFAKTLNKLTGVKTKLVTI